MQSQLALNRQIVLELYQTLVLLALDRIHSAQWDRGETRFPMKTF